MMPPGLSWQALLRQCPPGVRPQDARDWLLFLLQKTAVYLRSHGDDPVTASLYPAYQAGLARLQAGEPLAYLTGTQAFWTLALEVTPDTLIPRPDTERLVALALEKMTTPTGRLLDLGTGSGAIALALAQERPGWQVMAVDLSADTLQVARRNAQKYGLSRVLFRQGSWFAALAGDWPQPQPVFDLIVSNPPYLDPDDPHLPDLQHEPLRALVADQHGLADLQLLAGQARDWLRPGGWLLLEHGWDQGAAVCQNLLALGWQQVQTLRDYGGNDRVTLGQWLGDPAHGHTHRHRESR